MKRLKTSLKHLLRLLKTNFSMTRFSKKLLASQTNLLHHPQRRKRRKEGTPEAEEKCGLLQEEACQTPIKEYDEDE